MDYQRLELKIRGWSGESDARAEKTRLQQKIGCLIEKSNNWSREQIVKYRTLDYARVSIQILEIGASGTGGGGGGFLFCWEMYFKKKI